MEETPLRPFCWLAFVATWLSTGALGLVGLFMVQYAVRRAYLAWGLSKWAFAAVDKWLFFLLCLLWLGVVLYTQHTYGEVCRKGLDLRHLGRRFLRVMAIELGILFVAAGVQWLAV